MNSLRQRLTFTMMVCDFLASDAMDGDEMLLQILIAVICHELSPKTFSAGPPESSTMLPG